MSAPTSLTKKVAPFSHFAPVEFSHSGNTNSALTEISLGYSSEDFLQSVEDQLKKKLDHDFSIQISDPTILLKAARHLCLSEGAKRIRPRFIYLLGQAIEIPKHELTNIAVAAELLHAASLLHDDVVDESNMRRGNPTVNSLWGNNVAVLTGDLVLSVAIISLTQYPKEIYTSAVETVASMTRSAMLEVQARGNPKLTSREWFQIAEGKTAQLFSWCGKATASLSNDHRVKECFSLCGHNLGIAFQMADDVKDLLDANSGKSPLLDIRNRNPNIVVIEALSQDSSLQEELIKLWSSSDTISYDQALLIKEKILRTNALDQVMKELRTKIDAIASSLGEYQNLPGGREIIFLAELLWKNTENMRRKK